MAWLYVPETSSACALASEASSSASILPCNIGERLVEASATWRGSAQQPQAWSRRWRQGGFIRLLSGLTCSPSMLDHGVASFISSLRETPARRTALPESAQEPRESDSSLPRLSALPTSAGLILSSARTCRGTRTDSLTPSSRHWSDWATGLRQEYSARLKLATPCDASGFSSWPSATDPSTRGGSQTPEKRRAGGHAVNLEDVAENWEGPFVAVTEGSRMTRGGDRSDELLLTGQAVKCSEQMTNWAGPAAQNHKGSSQGSMIRQDGKSRADILSYQAEQFFNIPSSPDHPTIAGGSMSSTAGPNSNQLSVKRKLNPIFVEALMRWPTGLSGFERQATAWIQWEQRMRSYLSALYSKRAEPAQMEML